MCSLCLTTWNADSEPLFQYISGSPSLGGQDTLSQNSKCVSFQLAVGGRTLDQSLPEAFRGPLFPSRGFGIPDPIEIIRTLPEKAVVAPLFQKEQSVFDFLFLP